MKKLYTILVEYSKGDHQASVEPRFIDKSIKELGVKTLLQKSGITKRKGYPTLQLIFAFNLLHYYKYYAGLPWGKKNGGTHFQRQ